MRVEFTPLEVASAKTAASLNTPLNAIAAASNQIEDHNLQEEGLDRRVFDDFVVAKTDAGWVKQQVGPDVYGGAGYATYQQLVVGAVAMRISSPAITLPAESDFEVEARVTFETDPGGQLGVDAGTDAYVQLWYQPNGGAAAAVGHSERWTNFAEATVYTRHVFASGTIDWIEIRVKQAGGGNFRVGRAQLMGILHKNVS